MDKSNNPEVREQLENLQRKVMDYQTPDNEKSAVSRPRTQKERQSYIDEQISRAMDAGDFDNLPGKGKPLQLRKNPYADPGEELAFGLLKDNGFAPDWIECDKEIRSRIEIARNRLRTAWRHYQSHRLNERAWETAIARFNQELYKINKEIRHYNLIVPVTSKQRMPLQLTTEIQQLQESPK